MTETAPKAPWTPILSYVLIVMLTAEVVLLAKQNRDLKATINRMSAGPMETLKPGESVGTIAAWTLGGETRQLRFDDAPRKSLLFVLSTTCPHCEKNLPLWQEIAVRGGADSCRIVGVSLHDLPTTRAYVAAKGIRFEVVSAADSDFTRHYKIPGVPETILLDARGRVEKTWIGELSDAQTREILGLARGTGRKG